jgi:hypothetical protein
MYEMDGGLGGLGFPNQSKDRSICNSSNTVHIHSELLDARVGSLW